ncbi:ABC transporter permease subunit [Bacillus safensis]|uniref:ABC transporter permease subunit n=1 Tax=Bacillus safensis TaxID=561879 RepID=UPI002282D7A2|nr:ABC transporter permease subunit [Bacillus safensis]MCY7481588.1 ABC transporter permease [Bacillus safensis]MCY7514554.1 ABC transporter permease [Bacillus safensis]MED0718060.1 ABC transporter permease subunit [Bacillus safensis]MED4748414.1 ABC transporter permease subunit [Bacillus safensis]
MVKRQLLYKEWKQSELTFILVMLVAALATPFAFLMEYSSFQTCLNDTECITDAPRFSYIFKTDPFLSLSWLMGIFFAVMQLGFERNKGQMDFTLSLPFSRSTIYHTKFFLGAGIIAVAHAVSYVLTYLLILGLNPLETPGFHSVYIISLVSSLMFYSLFFAAGTLTGSSIAQAIVGFSTAILPFLVIGLPLVHVDFIIKTSGSWLDKSFAYLISPISPINYIIDEPFRSDYPLWFSGEKIIIPIVMVVLFYLMA